MTHVDPLDRADRQILKFEKSVMPATAILTKISDLNLMIVLSYFVKGHASTPYNNAGMNFN